MKEKQRNWQLVLLWQRSGRGLMLFLREDWGRTRDLRSSRWQELTFSGPGPGAEKALELSKSFLSVKYTESSIQNGNVPYRGQTQPYCQLLNAMGSILERKGYKYSTYISIKFLYSHFHFPFLQKLNCFIKFNFVKFWSTFLYKYLIFQVKTKGYEI